MRAAVFHGTNEIAIKKVPLPDKGVILKVNACAVCGYDARVYRNGHRKVNPPVILGHELCGELMKTVQSNGHAIKAGSRVAVCPLVPCLGCVYCKSGKYNLCANLAEIGSTRNGGFAQYVEIPEQLLKIRGLVAVPDGLTDEEASLLEPLACCLNSFSQMSPVEHGSPVVIIGDGPIGLLHLQLFKALTDARVGVVGKIPFRMDKARAMGADAVFAYGRRTARDVVENFAGESGAKIVIISTSNPEAFGLATQIAGKSGKINLFAGMPHGKILPLDPNWLHYNQISITGTFSSTPALLQEAARIAQEKVVDLSKVVTHQYPLADIEKAIEVTEKYSGLRAVINQF